MSLWTNTDADPGANTVVTAAITLLRTCTVASTTGLVKGDLLSGTGITAGTKIQSVDSATVFTLNQDAVNGGAVSITAQHANVNKPKSHSVEEQLTILGADVAEAQLKPITHSGWVKVITGTGGRAGRVAYETLVAMGSLSGDATDDATFAEPTIILTPPSNPVGLSEGAGTLVDLVVALSGTALPSGVSYQWQDSADDITYADVVGETADTISLDSAVLTAGTYYYQLVATIDGIVTTTSTTITVVVGA